MPRVWLFHWRAAEAGAIIDQIRAAGYTVDYRGDRMLGSFYRALREAPLHAIAIDLTRLPSDGLHLAIAIRSRKPIRGIPIVFVDGAPEKVAKIRSELPDAIYTSRAKLESALKRAKPLENPASPPHTNRTAAQKLGIREGTRVAVMDAPPGYAKAVGDLPEGASLEEDPTEILPVTLWFVRDPREYLAGLPRMRELAGKSRLWIIYPKRQRGKARAEVTMFFIRDAALAVGLAHYKTCSVNGTWSGLAFARKAITEK